MKFIDARMSILAAPFFACASVFAQDCLEVSKDGLTNFQGCGVGQGGIAGAGSPFSSTPNWENDIRLAVGGLQIEDMNGDGKLDLIVGCYRSSGFPEYPVWRNFIYYNTGSGLEAQPSWTSDDQVHTGDIHIADFNLDGYPDIFSVNGGTAYSKSVIYYGGPSGPDTSPDWQAAEPMITWAVSAAVFDFDHDGDVDVVTSNQTAIPDNTSRPLFLFQNDAGSLNPVPVWQSEDWFLSNGIDVGDIDNDGWEDIAVAKWVNFNSAVYRNQFGPDKGDYFSGLPMWASESSATERGAGIYDINKDGWNDIVFGSSSSSNPGRLWQHNGTVDPLGFTSVWSSPVFQSLQDLRWHDVDGDGDEDLGEAHFGNGQAHIYLNNDGVLSATPDWTYDPTQVANALAFGDINGDGCEDVAVGYSGDISIRVFYGLCPSDCPADISPDGGSGTVDVDDLLMVINNWGAAGQNPADITGDGSVDVDDLLAVINGWGACE